MLTFVPLSAEKDNRHIGESVFALSYRRNLVLACVFYANDTGVGIVSACLHPGFVRTSSVIGGRSSTLSFYYSSLPEFGETKLTTM